MRRHAALAALVALPVTCTVLATLAGCGSERPPDTASSGVSASAPAAPASGPAVAAVPAEVPRFRFTDVTESAGLAGFRHVSGGPEKLHLVESVGAGVAFLDHDGDGDLDVYLTNGSTFETAQPARDALYRNDGGTFTDVSAESGIADEAWTMGVNVADYDGDGLPDLYLTNFGPDVLLRNVGGAFRDVTKQAGLGEASWSTSATFFDLEGDGDLDLYVSAYMEYEKGETPASTEYCQYRGVMVAYGPRGMRGARDRVYEQVSPGRFRDVTEKHGVDAVPTYGFQPVAFDADEDGDTDVFVANDSVANYLWVNDAGRLREGAMRAGLAMKGSGDAQACMGASAGDLDGDGRLDLLVTNFSEDYDTAYRNDGRGFFTDATQSMRLAEPSLRDLGWGVLFLDADLDGDQDTIVANGHVYPQVDRFDFGFQYLERCRLNENLGRGAFRDAALAEGDPLLVPRAHRGAAAGDYDGDGDEDLLLGIIDGPPVLLRNDTEPRGHWLHVMLRDAQAGAPPGAQPAGGPGVAPNVRGGGLGARVVAITGGARQARLVTSGSSFCSSSAPGVHFGLGAATVADVEVWWPFGGREIFRGLVADRRVVLERGTGESVADAGM